MDCYHDLPTDNAEKAPFPRVPCLSVLTITGHGCMHRLTALIDFHIGPSESAKLSGHEEFLSAAMACNYSMGNCKR